MNHTAQPSMSSLENDLKNYKSLYEEIAQNDSKMYLNDETDNIARSDENSTECCCCKVHGRRNSFIAGGAITKSPFTIPIYNTIYISEMKNATDYIEYLNETRRNSFNSLNKDNRSHYYKLMLTDSHYNDYDVNNNSVITSQSKNLLQVPNKNADDFLRRPLTPQFKDISKKIEQIHKLDSSVSSLIYKSIEVHADILSLDATVSRLLAETRKLLEELEDAKCLDDIIVMLNSEIPVIHREWMYPITNSKEIPVDEGVIVRPESSVMVS